MTTQQQTVWSILCHKLAMGHPVTYRARGQSMRSMIPDGALVGLVPWPNGVVRPQVGDVVLAWDGQRAVLHRVIGRYQDRVWVKGDRNDRIDRFHISQLLAKAETVDGGPVHRTLGSTGAIAQVGLSLIHPVVKAVRRRLRRKFQEKG